MDHLVSLADGWTLWRWACLRSTGFPARIVYELASDELAAAADRVLACEADAATRRTRLIEACREAGPRQDPKDRASIQRALKRLWQHRVPDPIEDPHAEALRRELADAVARVDQATREHVEHHARAARATSRALRRCAADDRFRQALLWQNRSAVRGGIDGLLRQPVDASDSRTRSNERLIASYVQRYCVKNDTIGFFGPCGWARLEDQPTAIAQHPGPGLLAHRIVYYEFWAIDLLARKLSADPALRPFLAPRILPRYRLDGATLHHPIERTTELHPDHVAVLSRCDGVRTAREIARDIRELPEAEVFAVLDELVEAQVIHWELEIPTAGPHPERQLATLLERVADDEPRQRALATLERLEQARAVVAASREANQLDAALAAFEATFNEITEAAGQRAHGQMYAGRTPLYEECRRDLDVALGRPVLDRLAGPLALLLQSARWFTHEIALRYRRELHAIHDRVGRGERVDFATFWQHVPALFPGAGASGSIVESVREELRRRWAAVLAIEPAERSVERSAEALGPAVRDAFAAPCPGWPAARHHSPDVMIAAPDAAAIARGEYRLVIGELHSGLNTIAGMFLKLHPQPAELIADRDADIDRVCIAPVWTKAISKADYYSPSPRDLDLEAGETRSARPRSHVLRTGDLVVELRDGALEVATRDGAHRFDIIAFLEHHLIAESHAAFSPIAPAPVTPRVTIDAVVIARASWRVVPAELTWTAIDDAPGRFLGARRWAQALGLPRCVFVKTPEEVKPVYVDFASTVFVESLAKLVRGASAVTVSEMLPTVDETWVADAEGARYTSELRTAAVDPEPWRPVQLR